MGAGAGFAIMLDIDSFQRSRVFCFSEDKKNIIASSWKGPLKPKPSQPAQYIVLSRLEPLYRDRPLVEIVGALAVLLRERFCSSANKGHPRYLPSGQSLGNGFTLLLVSLSVSPFQHHRVPRFCGRAVRLPRFEVGILHVVIRVPRCGL